MAREYGTQGLAGRQFTALDRSLVDYQPRRPLSADPADDCLIRRLVRGVRVVPYAEAPFFAALQWAQGDVGTTDGDANEAARDALFQRQPVVDVPVAALTWTQNVVNMRAIRHLLSGGDAFDDKAIYVVRYAGTLYVVDGHHRAVAAAMEGRQNIPAHLLNL